MCTSFGFKNRIRPGFILCIKNTLDYYSEHGKAMCFVASLTFTKAFDFVEFWSYHSTSYSTSIMI